MIAGVLGDLLTAAEDVPTPEPRDWWTILQQAVAFGIALATLYALVIRPAINRASKHFRESVAEVVTAQQVASSTLERVNHQVHPNGGKSAHDYARKAYEEAQAIRAEQRHQGSRMDHMQGELTAMGWRQQEQTEALREHSMQGREFLARARETLAEQGVHLPAHDDAHEDVRA